MRGTLSLALTFHIGFSDRLLLIRRLLLPLALLALSLPAATAQDHLLLTEILVTPTESEFIEIHNPTGSTIDLSDVYLTDATFSGGGTYYYNIVTGTNAGGGGFGDFHARFPDGASIDPGEYQTVAMTGSDDFFAAFGIQPTYELFEDGGAPDAIPDMREAVPGSINNQGGLTNGGEVVILYQWDGASDLVQDLDYAVWGDKDEAVDKSGVAVDGPDADATTSTYLDDTAVAGQDVVSTSSHSSSTSYQRLDLTEGNETTTGGNGTTGHDETSEDLSATWATATPTPNAESETTPPPTGEWVINEIHADPDPTNGDANGDGSVDTAEDEFVEIVNVSGAPVDISGWTLSDGIQVRHTFPAGTTIPDQCGAVVFAAGTPTGEFGNTTVQTASSGQIGLNNGGDTVTLNDGSSDVASVTYGGEGGNDQSLTRDPDLFGLFAQHSTATGSGGALFSPGTRIDGSPFSGCPVTPTAAEIHDIQGSGLASPYDGQPVTTEDNVVTAVGPEGFFIQTPDARADADPETSEGLYVFTGSAPTVAVGQCVDVSGTVQEFFDFTEFGNTGLSVTVDAGCSAPLPTPITFDAATPSPDQPQDATAFERFEGMLIQINGGTVAESNQSFGSDPIAEVFVTAAGTRPFREKGIRYPGLPGLPVWDGNPEVFELDPDKLGLPNEIIPAGSSFDATGALAFEFGGYELWPTSLTFSPSSFDPVSPSGGDVSVGTLNLFRLFNDVNDPGPEDDGTVVPTEEYEDRLEKVSAYIRTQMGAPDVLAVQEVENLSTLQDLAAQLLADGGPAYTAYLEEGNDIGGIDVGFLVQNTVENMVITQLGAAETYTNPTNGLEEILHDRPPLLLEGTFMNTSPPAGFMVLNLHQRSLSGIDGGDADANRVKVKRDAQARSVATMVEDRAGNNLIVLGDFNAFQFTDGYVDVLGQITGTPDPDGAEIPVTPIVTSPLTNLVTTLPADEQYSFVFNGSAQVLDHILVSPEIATSAPKALAGELSVSGVAYARGNADAAEILIEDPTTLLRSSDHDGLVVFLTLVSLPVELASLEAMAEDAAVRLDWTTASETNNAGFEVEMRTPDFGMGAESEPIRNPNSEIRNVGWQSVGWVEGHGSTREPRTYTYRVENLDPGTYRFRLKQLDFDGGFEYSPEVEASVELVGPYLIKPAYPNPFNPMTTFRFAVSTGQPVTVKLYNVIGEAVGVLYEDVPEPNAMQTVRVHAGHLPSGVYFVRLEGATFTASEKVVLLR